MAGHSKWANTKHRKERSDAKKGKLFTKATKEIITSVKEGGPDPKLNPRLRAAIEKARSVNMPTENIERNIKKASAADQAAYEEVVYEIYGYGGVGLVVAASTDNRNRTASEIRIALNKRGGTHASPGSVLFNFDHQGVIQMQFKLDLEEKLLEDAIDAGAEDLHNDGEYFYVVTGPKELYQVQNNLTQRGYNFNSSDLAYLPKVHVECSEEDQHSNQALIDWLEDIEDVDQVYHNMG
jgi:YebC/PmpR family DNA-binding regulatory protein